MVNQREEIIVTNNGIVSVLVSFTPNEDSFFHSILFPPKDRNKEMMDIHLEEQEIPTWLADDIVITEIELSLPEHRIVFINDTMSTAHIGLNRDFREGMSMDVYVALFEYDSNLNEIRNEVIRVPKNLPYGIPVLNGHTVDISYISGSVMRSNIFTVNYNFSLYDQDTIEFATNVIQANPSEIANKRIEEVTIQEELFNNQADDIDLSTGEITFGNVIERMQSLTNSTTYFVNYVGNVISFLPNEIISLIVMSFGLSILLRILGR